MATRTKKAPVVEEVEDDLELDELDEDVEEETSDGKGSSNAVTFGVRDLSEYLSKKLGKEIKPKDLRTLIRKMAREAKPRVNREVVAGNRSRYDWVDGLQDPEVQAIIAAVTKGELEQGKKEALEALKARKAEQKAAGETPTKKKKTAPVVEDIIEEDEEFDEDLLEED